MKVRLKSQRNIETSIPAFRSILTPDGRVSIPALIASNAWSRGTGLNTKQSELLGIKRESVLGGPGEHHETMLHIKVQTGWKLVKAKTYSDLSDILSTCDCYCVCSHSL
jgi:hypothetical protein